MRLIDADALLERERVNPFVKMARGYGKGLLNACMTYLNVVVSNAPTVDAVPVVRCRDCKHCREKDMFGMKKTLECLRIDGAVEPEHFCSYGERRET